MKRNILCVIFITIILIIKGQDVQFEWAKQLGGTLNDYSRSISIDNSGYVYITGSFAGTCDFDPGINTYNLISEGQGDIFICKLDYFGNFVWANRFGGNAYDGGESILVNASGNIYATGRFSGIIDINPGNGTYYLTSAGSLDIYISEFDQNGNFIWAKSFGGTSDDYVNPLSVDTYGNIYVSGIFSGTVDFDPGNEIYNLTSIGSYDIYILKLNATGDFIWARSFGGTDLDFVSSLSVDKYNDIYITGTFRGTVDFDPGIATYNLTASGINDVFILSLDSYGNLIWASKIGGNSTENVGTLSLDSNSNIYLTGLFMGTADFDPGIGTYNLTSLGSVDIFICKINSSGNLIFAKQFGGAQSYNERGISISIDSYGNIYSVGQFENTADFDPDDGIYNMISVGYIDIYISKLNPSGNFIWAKQLGGISNDQVHSIISNDAGEIYTTGNFSSTVDFDPGNGTYNLTTAGGWDMFIHKMSQILEPTTYTFSIGVYLEGSFSGSQMTTGLNTAGLLPLLQPFNTFPWEYNGVESVETIPNVNIVDWVLVELRETTGDPSSATSDKMIYRQAAFVNQNGYVVGLDGISPITYTGEISDNLFLIINHRNHLPIMSSQALIPSGNTYSYDFTNLQSKAYLDGQKSISENIFGMIGGDSDANMQINNQDKDDIWLPESGSSGYKGGDSNMDGNVDIDDKDDFWQPNSGKGSQVPQ